MYTRDVKVGGPVRVRARHQPPEDGRDLGGAEPLLARQQQPVHLRGGQAPSVFLSLVMDPDMLLIIPGFPVQLMTKIPSEASLGWYNEVVSPGFTPSHVNPFV